MAINVLLFLILSLLHCSSILYAEGAEAPTLDPNEVEALKVIAKGFGKKNWNFGADPCSWNQSGPKWDSNMNVYADYINCTCKMGEPFCHVISIVIKRQSLLGVVPPELANLTYLEMIDLTGNYLHGSIPPELGSLTHLMKLSLGINNLSGLIPEELGNLNSLKILSLNTNNLYGRLPRMLGKLKQLEILYLGNNSLRGNLERTSLSFESNIQYIDLSYNNFSGQFPSWSTSEAELKSNLIENSFSSNLASESDDAYLQRGFICEKGAPLYTSLAINCGGESWNAPAFISFEGDQNQLSPSKFYLSPEKNWAVSNTGLFYDNQNRLKFLVNTNHSQFTTGINPKLYMTARCSASSLRYYGLCLHNGPYKVQLHFAEIEFPDDKSFKGLGRRIFDVYIQGTRKLQNFNIEVEAGGRYKPIVKTFNVNVTENYLEIHFLWAGKGTYNVPFEGTYGPLVSAIVVSPEFKIKNKSNHRTLIIGIISGIAISLGVVAFLSFIFIRKRNGTKNSFLAADVGRELTNMNIIFGTFALEDIRSATNDFRIENKIGEGGFGTVFKGILPDGKMVAVKQMFAKSRQGSREFLNELGAISAVQHPNLVKLYGCCTEGKQLLLVYEYLENTSLARALFGPHELRLKLNWSERYNICLGVARGLAYLHEESRLRIIQCDIKATNILLDQHLNPKISDFGLAKVFDLEKTHVSTRVAGTIGYMAPEYPLKGQLTEKDDVYSFGVLVLEVVSGRARTEKTLPTEMVHLLEWTWHLYEENRLLDLVDVNLKSSKYSKEEVLRMINVGLLCTYATPMLRPSMSQVVGILEGKIEGSVSHTRSSYLGNWESSAHKEETANDTQEMPSTHSLSWEGPWKESSSSSSSAAKKQ